MIRRLGAVLAAGVTAVAQDRPASAQAQAPVTAFVNVSLIPMDRERVVSGQTVVVRGDRIVALGPAGEVAVPAGAVRVDGRGKFLLPGFADMHVHIGDTSRQITEASLLLFVANGVTTVREMPNGGLAGGNQAALLDLRRRVAKDELIGPRIYTAGEPDWRSSPAVARSVADLAADGYDFLAVGREENATGPLYDSVLTAARRAGLRIAGEVSAARGIMAALHEHWASIEHLTGYYGHLLNGYDPAGLLDQADLAARLVDTATWMRPTYRPNPARLRPLAQATRRAGVWNCPTLRIWHYFDADAPAVHAVASPSVADMRSSQARKAKPIRRDSAPDQSLEPLLHVARRVGEIGDWITKSLQEAGAGLLLGTDTGDDAFPDAPPGFSVAREMQLAVKAGLTPYQALAMGTRNVAVFMGTSDTAGTIALGKRADLVLLDGDPLRDISRVAGPAGVMVGGRWHARAELDAQLDRLGAWKDFDLHAVRRTLWRTAAPSP